MLIIHLITSPKSISSTLILIKPHEKHHIVALNDIVDIVGTDAVEEFVRIFYEKVADDPVLRPLYRDDLTTPRLHLQWYLVQIFGGKRRYAKERGKPRTISRHVPIAIGQKERDRWMELMTKALHESTISDYPKVQQQIIGFFDMFSTKLINNKLFTIYSSF